MIPENKINLIFVQDERVIKIKPWSFCTLYQWVWADLHQAEADSTKPAAESVVFRLQEVQLCVI